MNCILCGRDASIIVLFLPNTKLQPPTTYGLCDACFLLPDHRELAELAIAVESATGGALPS